jgi:hypothetical protein
MPRQYSNRYYNQCVGMYVQLGFTQISSGKYFCKFCFKRTRTKINFRENKVVRLDSNGIRLPLAGSQKRSGTAKIRVLGFEFQVLSPQFIILLTDLSQRDEFSTKIKKKHFVANHENGHDNPSNKVQ